MTKFTERIEHDLSQIADRATPSSTAWESIQQRIAEQDSEPTMEVIMLNPDQKKPPTVSRTWMAVAAALVIIVGIGSLFAVLNQDDGGDTDTVDTPDVTVPLDLESSQPAVDAPPATIDPTLPLPMSGEVVADCVFSEDNENPDGLAPTSPQSCEFLTDVIVPFEVTQEYVLTKHVEPDYSDFDQNRIAPITGISESGFMYAGYMWIGNALNVRFVGVADGVGPYEGMLIRVTGRSFAGNGQVFMEWAAGDDLSSLGISGVDVPLESASLTCELSNFVDDGDGNENTQQYDNTCTTSGNESPLFTAPRTQTVFLSGLGPFEPTVGDSRYALTPGETFVAGGIFSADGTGLTAGIELGTGDYEGLFIHSMSVTRTDATGGAEGEIRRIDRTPGG